MKKNLKFFVLFCFFTASIELFSATRFQQFSRFFRKAPKQSTKKTYKQTKQTSGRSSSKSSQSFSGRRFYSTSGTKTAQGGWGQRFWNWLTGKKAIAGTGTLAITAFYIKEQIPEFDEIKKDCPNLSLCLIAKLGYKSLSDIISSYDLDDRDDATVSSKQARLSLKRLLNEAKDPKHGLTLYKAISQSEVLIALIKTDLEGRGIFVDMEFLQYEWTPFLIGSKQAPFEKSLVKSKKIYIDGLLSKKRQYNFVGEEFTRTQFDEIVNAAKLYKLTPNLRNKFKLELINILDKYDKGVMDLLSHPLKRAGNVGNPYKIALPNYNYVDGVQFGPPSDKGPLPVYGSMEHLFKNAYIDEKIALESKTTDPTQNDALDFYKNKTIDFVGGSPIATLENLHGTRELYEKNIKPEIDALIKKYQAQE